MEEQVRELMAAALARRDWRGARVLVIIPDSTRTAPIPLFYRLFNELLRPQVTALDYLVALGTHQPMSDEALCRLVGVSSLPADPHIYNHHWERPGTFATLGVIPAAAISALSEGRLTVDVPVAVNRLALDHDQLIICGPTFPHEVVGFSGGNKYLVPGIAGPDIINLTHWLGALITSMAVIGTRHTPVRAVIDRAAALVDRPKLCFSLVIAPPGSAHAGELAGLYIGSPEEAYEAAADLSSQLHIVWLDQPVRRVLSIIPPMYDDLWTAAKGMYKLEPAIADGGEVIIYAPHITEVSYTHGAVIDQVGYHCCDYFQSQWDEFQDRPWGVLAHSTHLHGLGTYDPATGVEQGRIRVTLATGIPEERCRRINVGYMDPATIDVNEWAGRGDEGILVVPKAGEMLYKIRK
ncbi:MAG: DUF2088 domain-containing protein [Chloroflexi bacterium]|nr:DUF2088 domain-containing protein [Chloroflexota bacterium]MBU1750960.1 DUF2088 domain-containing protein [Chloroflexota bacterium]MBU1878297.1 DUF2088 domain-containing protein [Chloroflexota bacterium]